MDEPGVFFARVNSTLSATLVVLFGKPAFLRGTSRLLYVFSASHDSAHIGPLT